MGIGKPSNVSGRLREDRRTSPGLSNLVEGRDDIAYDEDHDETIKEIIFELANPVLSGKLNELKA